MMRKKISSFLCVMIIAVCCNAQTTGYKFYAPLDSVKTSGFYNIEITPELSAHLKTDYSDLRIVNDSGKWVPHILRLQQDQSPKSILTVSLKIEEKKNAGNFTEIILSNDSNFIDALDILLKPTSATRVAKLSGSDDRKDWFVIEDSLSLVPVNKNKDVKYHLQFPSCNYRFYKILIDNKNNDPVNILSVSYDLNMTMRQVEFRRDNPACKLQQKDSGKISYIKISQDSAFHFEHFSLKISGSKYFYRKAELYLANAANSTYLNPGTLCRSFYISNKSIPEFEIPISNAKDIYLWIYNEDNLPLKIEKVTTWNNLRSITAYLDKGNNYRLIMDNSAATIPDYDLSRSGITLADTLPYLFFGQITPFKQDTVKIQAVKNNNWILWTSIAAALFILLLFTRKMLAEVDKRKNNDTI